MTYNNYRYTFSMTLRDEFDKVDTVKVEFKAKNSNDAICKIEEIVNTFLSSAGYPLYDKDRILLKSISDDEETALADFLDYYRIDKENEINDQ